VVVAPVGGRRSVLLTQLARTDRDGWWTLPGGGLDPGEEPEAGVLREVREETGQTVADLRPLDVVTAHWTGRAPSGRLEDFHAVRLVYRADCPHPTEPEVHDPGGTTAAAAWVPVADLGRTSLVGWTLPLIRKVSGG
jgi:8-oxo-dGTP diphosphatase